MAFIALTLLVGRPGGIQPVKTEWWGAGMVICLKRGADLHMAQLVPLPLTVPCFSKIQIGFTFLVPADPGSPRHAVKRVCVFYTCISNAKQVTNGISKWLQMPLGQCGHIILAIILLLYYC